VRVRTRLSVVVIAVSLLALSARARAQANDALRPSVTFDLAVPGGRDTLDAIGILPEERGIALELLARGMQGSGANDPNGMATRLAPMLAAGAQAQSGAAPDSVVAPFSAGAWRRVLELADGQELFTRLLADRGALLVAAGALGADVSLRALLDRDRTLLRSVVRERPGAFAVVAPALRVGDGRIQVPGGAEAEGAWAALVGVPPARPAEFIRALVLQDEGRTARFYTNVAALSAERWRALVPAGPGSVEALRALATLARNAEPVWDANDHPYLRTGTELWSVLQVAPGPERPWPWHARLWPTILARDARSRRDAEEAVVQAPAAPPAYADLLRVLLDSDVRDRRDRLTMIGLLNDAFAGAPVTSGADIVLALGGYRAFPSLLLALDRMGITAPGTWAVIVEAARHADRGSGRDREDALVLFQSAVALVERCRVVRSLDVPTADRVLRALADAVLHEPSALRAVQAWLPKVLVPALPELQVPDAFTWKDTVYESRLLQAMAGTPATGAPIIQWEGQPYAVDLFFAEHDRLLQVRALVPSPGLDAALASGEANPLLQALVALVYVPALGDPDGPVTLSPDVVRRHGFGVGSRAPESERLAWAPPVERTGSGGPWHVDGALLGLDLALARLALRRIAADDMPAVPTANLNDVLMLTATVMAQNPYELDDGVRDAIAAAIERGRRRVLAPGADLAALGREASLPAAMVQSLPLMGARDAAHARAVFTLVDLFRLGATDGLPADLDHWGVIATPLEGRWGTRFPRAGAWDTFGGRPDLGLMATRTPDLTLRLVEATARLKLPARLVPALLAYATQDLWYAVEARFSDDQPALARAAAALSDARIEDYVAALTSNGPLRPH
jgi:hypothetical protein